MRNRSDILKDLVLLESNIDMLIQELSLYPWDADKPFFYMNIKDLTKLLKRCLNDEINFDTLYRWANIIECRDDIEFETEEMQEIIFYLANPEINCEITKKRLIEMITLLEN